jgi:hypothetical protein
MGLFVWLWGGGACVMRRTLRLVAGQNGIYVLPPDPKQEAMYVNDVLRRLFSAALTSFLTCSGELLPGYLCQSDNILLFIYHCPN